LAESAVIDGQVSWRLTKEGLARGSDLAALTEEMLKDEFADTH
jgi:hypothetical protein